MNKSTEKKLIKEDLDEKRKEFEAKQNATGFFSVLLKVAKKNPDIWKQICNEKNENNRDTNNTN